MFSTFENGNIHGFVQSSETIVKRPITVSDKFLGKFELSLDKSYENNNNLRINHETIQTNRVEFWKDWFSFDFVDLI